MLTLVEGFSGVLFIALTVGYLPSLYSSFAQREGQLLLLDDSEPGVVTPMGLAVEFLDGSTDFRDLDDTLVEWERWVVMVLESHTSNPILSYFRSQHAGQSWVTGMGLMADVAAIVVVVQGERVGPAWRLYRRCVRTFDVMVQLLRLDDVQVADMTHRSFQENLDEWARHGWPLPRDPEAMRDEYQSLRRAYTGQLQALAKHLDAPPGFWSQASSPTQIVIPDEGGGPGRALPSAAIGAPSAPNTPVASQPPSGDAPDSPDDAAE